ncbi:MAG: hypothetical protein PHN82_08955 [bacterium]|nr:hypothetical protein [bacterium]
MKAACERPAPLMILSVVLAVYVVSPLLVPEQIDSMQLSVVYLTMAVARTGSAVVDDVLRDKTDLACREGHYYSGVAPGLSYLAVPHYLVISPLTNKPERLVGIFSITFTSVLISLSFMCLYLLLREMGSREQEARSLTYLCAFGTLFLVYGTTFDSRALASALSIVVFYLIHHRRDAPGARGWIAAGAAGLLLGILPTLNYPSALLLPPFSIYFLHAVAGAGRAAPARRRLAIGIFLACLAVPLCLLMRYHAAAFGNCVLTGYSFRCNPLQQGYHADGIAGFTYPRMGALFHLLFLPYRGLVFYMPIFLLSFLGVVAAARNRRPEFVLAGTCMALFILFNAGLHFWSGEYCFGPRLLTEAIPFAIILAAPVVARYRKLYYGVFVYSVVLNAIGLHFRTRENIGRPFVAILRYVFELVLHGFHRSHPPPPCFDGNFPCPRLLAGMLAAGGRLGLLLLLVSIVLFRFRAGALLAELSGAVRKRLVGSIPRIVLFSVLFGAACAVANRLASIIDIRPRVFFAVASLNFFTVALVVTVFSDILFSEVVSIEEGVRSRSSGGPPPSGAAEAGAGRMVRSERCGRP